eukprot:12399763-Karenia_brevis.AAC.2
MMFMRRCTHASPHVYLSRLARGVYLFMWWWFVLLCVHVQVVTKKEGRGVGGRTSGLSRSVRVTSVVLRACPAEFVCQASYFRPVRLDPRVRHLTSVLEFFKTGRPYV